MMKVNKISKIVLFFVLLAGLFVFVITFPYRLFVVSKTGLILDKSNYDAIIANAFLNESNAKVLATDGEDKTLNEYIVNYKLFNLFNILSLKVKVSDNSVYLGGDCLGFSLKTKGLLVVGSNYVFTKGGTVNPFVASGLQVGDLIVSMQGKEINSIDTLNDILAKSNGESILLGVVRNGEAKTLSITPAKDLFSGEYKLGLWIKNNTEGVGTLTFVDDESLRFGSLGHGIYMNGSNSPIDVAGGDIYDCNVVGIKKGTDGVPGEIMGAFSKTNSLGRVEKNCDYGVYGYLNEDNDILYKKQLMAVGGRSTVTPGRAQIFSSLDGKNIKAYDIEIIKVNYQNSSSQKSIVFRVVDKELLALTGGIIQGMSGSPIVQNNKIIGAVTHVFVNDPTKGFGLYLDWMLLE